MSLPIPIRRWCETLKNTITSKKWLQTLGNKKVANRLKSYFPQQRKPPTCVTKIKFVAHICGNVDSLNTRWITNVNSGPSAKSFATATTVVAAAKEVRRVIDV